MGTALAEACRFYTARAGRARAVTGGAKRAPVLYRPQGDVADLPRYQPSPNQGGDPHCVLQRHADERNIAGKADRGCLRLNGHQERQAAGDSHAPQAENLRQHADAGPEPDFQAFPCRTKEGRHGLAALPRPAA